MNSNSFSSKSYSTENQIGIKEQAIVFYENNKVPKKMEAVLNIMFNLQPRDIYGYMCKYFEEFCLSPEITKIKGKKVLDSHGRLTIQTEIYGYVKNMEELLSAETVATCIARSETTKLSELELAYKEREEYISYGLTYINEEFNNHFNGLHPEKQIEVDAYLLEFIEKIQIAAEKTWGIDQTVLKSGPAVPSKDIEEQHPKKGKGKLQHKKKDPTVQTIIMFIPDEPLEKLALGSSAIGATSQAICVAGAKAIKKEVYEHIAYLMTEEEVSSGYHVPIPMVTVLECSGKLEESKIKYIKEFIIVPQPQMSLRESYDYLRKISQSIRNILLSKYSNGGLTFGESGAPLLVLDRLEQGLDIITYAVSSVGLVLGKHIFVILNCAAHRIFDQNRGMYEVHSESFKLANDLIGMYVDILNNHNYIIGLIDPLRKQDAYPWMQLADQISQKCYIIGDFVYHHPGRLLMEEISKEFLTNGIILRLQNKTTIIQFIECVKKYKEATNNIIVGISSAAIRNTFLADLAVGIGAEFIYLGSLNHEERICKFERLIQIGEKLDTKAQILNRESGFQFTKINAPSFTANSPDLLEPIIPKVEEKKKKKKGKK